MGKKYRIVTIPGDGIGHEVLRATISVLETLAETRGDLDFDFIELLAGDRVKLKTGITLPTKTIEGIKSADASLFAAVGETAREVIPPLRQDLAREM